MKLKRRVIIFAYLLALALCAGVFFIKKADSYDDQTTHPAITDEIVDFFNLSYPDLAITPEEKEWVVRGSMDEDTWPRWINHFYDPVYNQGWTAEKMGNISPSNGLALNKMLLSDYPPAPSKYWAQLPNIQAQYKTFGGDRTWQRAIYELANNNNRQEALYTLGHILHLLEDSTVPDHTRNDTHAHPLQSFTGDYGSPYEEYTKKYIRSNGKTNLPITAELLFTQRIRPNELSSLNSYFDLLAAYSNSHFFSKDTISSGKYHSPKVDYYDDNYAYSWDDDGTKFPVALVEKVRKNGFSMETTFTLDNPVNDQKILDAYFSRLSRAAIVNGAGAMKLYFDEVKKTKEGEEPLPAIPEEKAGVNSLLANLKQDGTSGFLKGAINIFANNASSWLDSISISFVKTVKVSLGLQQPTIEVNDQPMVVSDSVVKMSLPQAGDRKIVVTPPSKAPAEVLGEKIVGEQTDTAPASAQSQSEPAPSTEQVKPKPTVGLTGYSGGGTTVVANVETSAAQTAAAPAPATSNEQTAPTSSEPAAVVPTSTPPADTTPPTVPDVSLTSEIGTSTRTLQIVVKSTDAGGGSVVYDVEYAACNGWGCAAPTSSWMVVARESSSTIYLISAERGQTYYVRARATDEAGNVSEWSTASNTATFINWSGEVVFNEVAWAGTSSLYPNDEWFELYNTTDQPIDIKNWQIKISGTPISIAKIATTIIPAHSFALYERGRDGAVTDIPADVIYTSNNGMSDKGDVLELVKPNGEKADVVDASRGWFGGDAILYRTMERIKPFNSGSDPLSWQTNKGIRVLGRSYNGGQLHGSPKQPNVGFLALNYRQEDPEVTLTTENNPYVLQYYEIPTGSILYVQPGVVIKSYYTDAKIDVYGSLDVQGDRNKRVVFTSGRDHSFGDSLLDTIVGTAWSTSTPLAKDWQGIWLHTGANTSIAGATIRYAGKDFKVLNNGSVSQAVRADGARLAIQHSTFSDDGSVAVHVESASTTINDVTFKNGGRALEAIDSKLSVQQTEISNFTDNQTPLFVKGLWPSFGSLSLHDNTINVPFLSQVVVNEAATIGENSIVALDNMSISATSSLTVNPGVIFYFTKMAGMDVRGSLWMNGAADRPIILAPYASGTYWGSIVFTNSTSALHHVVMTGGNGVQPRTSAQDGMLIANNSTVTCDDCSLINPRSPGNTVQTTNSNFILSNSLIGYSTPQAFQTIGIKMTSGTLTMGDTLFSNVNYGLYAGATPAPPVTATNISSSSFSHVDRFTEPQSWFAQFIAP